MVFNFISCLSLESEEKLEESADTTEEFTTSFFFVIRFYTWTWCSALVNDRIGRDGGTVDCSLDDDIIADHYR